MPGYDKISVRFENLGLNLVHSPITLELGEYTVLKNVESDIEGELIARLGFGTISTSQAALDDILNIKRLQDNINSKSSYFCKAVDGKVYSSMTAAAAGAATTTSPFFMVDTGATGLSTNVS